MNSDYIAQLSFRPPLRTDVFPLQLLKCELDRESKRRSEDLLTAVGEDLQSGIRLRCKTRRSWLSPLADRSQTLQVINRQLIFRLDRYGREDRIGWLQLLTDPVALSIERTASGGRPPPWSAVRRSRNSLSAAVSLWFRRR